MTWGNIHDDDLDSLHSGDDDTTEFFDATPQPVKESKPINIEEEAESSYKSPIVNKGIRDQQGITITSDEPSKWDKYKI